MPVSISVHHVPCTVGWPYTECICLYFDYTMWFVLCAVVVLTGFVMCGCGCVCVCVYVLVL